MLGPNGDPDLLEKWSKQKECMCMCYLRSAGAMHRATTFASRDGRPQRPEECKGTHWRPEGTTEQDFIVVDLHAKDITPEHATTPEDSDPFHS